MKTLVLFRKCPCDSGSALSMELCDMIAETAWLSVIGQSVRSVCNHSVLTCYSTSSSSSSSFALEYNNKHTIQSNIQYEKNSIKTVSVVQELDKWAQKYGTYSCPYRATIY